MTAGIVVVVTMTAFFGHAGAPLRGISGAQGWGQEPAAGEHADQRPHWQWTAKVNGKTVNRRFNKTQAALYQEWIANDRQLRDLITQMRHVAAKATELIIQEANENAKV